MPYIQQSNRNVIDNQINDLIAALKTIEGDPSGNINYAITRILKAMYPGNSYGKDINPAMGVMFAAALEYYRVVAVPYEVQKSYENGLVE